MIKARAYLYFVRIPLWSLIGLMIGMGIWARRGLLDWRRMLDQNRELEAHIRNARIQKESLERQIEAFSTDRAEQERIIRGQLGYVRNNETVIEFE